MKYLPLLLLFLTTIASSAPKTLRVAIVDTGLDITDSRFEGHICPAGHKDFTGTGLQDIHSHGTFIAGLIEQNAGPGNYCFLIYKYYLESNPGSVNLDNEVLALQEAVDNGADIVNFSGGGPIFDEKEFLVIKNNPKVKFVVAAGNDGQNLDLVYNAFYPASYYLKNEVVVGNVDILGNRVPSSNYGSKVVNTQNGDNVKSFLPPKLCQDLNPNCEGYMTGTSMSTAVKTGKLVRKILNAK
jgi:subtilisin family serine protease